MNKHTIHDTDPHLDRETEKYGTPVPSREFILDVLKSVKYPLKAKQLIQHFQLTDPELIDAFKRRLKAMIRDGQVVKQHEGFVWVEDANLVEGKLVLNRDGEGVCLTDDNQVIPLQDRSIRGLYEGDRISVQVKKLAETKERMGLVSEVLEATVPRIVGRLFKQHQVFKVQPFSRKMPIPITIPKGNKAKAKPNDIVVVEILREERLQTHYEPVGQVVEILGDDATPGIEIQMAIRKFNLPDAWPAPVLKASEKLPTKVTPQSKQHREDLTSMAFVTIDGEDAMDFDDAVYCEPYAKGWRLWVAIADVSYYVRPNTPLDKEAKQRGNSTYFPGTVVPMLPEALSNQLCSLKPEEDRLAMVCKMNIAQDGRVTRSQFMRAVIRSQARLTYTKVAAMYDGDQKLIKQYAKLQSSLNALLDCYHALRKLREIRGALDLDTIETKIAFAENGKIEKIVPVTRNIAHKVIEESMLATNVCAARFILRHKRPALFRVHDRPPPEKLKTLRAFIHELGLSLQGKDKPEAADIAALLESIKERPDRHLIETMVLRSLSQAQYRAENVGHFGLAYPYYVHFTSPIRRYPDLVIHRVVLDILEANKKSSYSHDALSQMGEHLSHTERRSDEATRDATFALKCHYMLDKVGEVYEGVVSGVTHFGLFVELKEIFVEGLIHVSQLGRDYFIYDPVKHCMIGEMSRQIFQMGQTVTVRVVRVELDDRKIDLELVEGGSGIGKQRVNKQQAAPAEKQPQRRPSKRQGSPKIEAEQTQETYRKPKKHKKSKNAKQKRKAKRSKQNKLR